MATKRAYLYLTVSVGTCADDAQPVLAVGDQRLIRSMLALILPWAEHEEFEGREQKGVVEWTEYEDAIQALLEVAQRHPH